MPIKQKTGIAIPDEGGDEKGPKDSLIDPQNRSTSLVMLCVAMHGHHMLTYFRVHMGSRRYSKGAQGNYTFTCRRRQLTHVFDQRTYGAVIDLIRSSEGISGLYSGLNSSLFGISVTNFVCYYFYGRGRTALVAARTIPGSKGLTTAESLLNGFIAGSTTSIISNPTWVIQTQQAVRTIASGDPSAPKQVVLKKLSFVETAQKIINKDGVGRLWAGIGPALTPSSTRLSKFYTVFEQLKTFIMQCRTTKLRAAGSHHATSFSDMDYFILGALSKLVATSFTYPYIIVKSRLQAGSAQCTSAWAGLQAIIGKEGVGGLYKGITAKLIQSVFTATILFAGQKRVYEVTKRTMVTARLVKA